MCGWFPKKSGVVSPGPLFGTPDLWVSLRTAEEVSATTDDSPAPKSPPSPFAVISGILDLSFTDFTVDYARPVRLHLLVLVSSSFACT